MQLLCSWRWPLFFEFYRALIMIKFSWWCKILSIPYRHWSLVVTSVKASKSYWCLYKVLVVVHFHLVVKFHLRVVFEQDHEDLGLGSLKGYGSQRFSLVKEASSSSKGVLWARRVISLVELSSNTERVITRQPFLLLTFQTFILPTKLRVFDMISAITHCQD